MAGTDGGAAGSGSGSGKDGRFVVGRWLRVRAWSALSLLVGCFGLLGYRAYILQVREAESLRQMAEDQYLRDVEIAPRRGRILDRNGVELAASAELDSLACNQRVLGERVGSIARALAGPLHLDRSELEHRLRGKHYFAWIKRRLDPEEARAVKELAISGLTLVPEPRRYYPNRELAGPLLGWAGVDAVGQEGLELARDHELRGARTQVPGLRDALGRAVLIGGIADVPTSSGQDVETTIDRHIQFRLEQALVKAVAAHHAKAGSAVAMDPRNGEVLALATVPTLNPNDPGDAREHGARLRPVTDPFEPGSTMKTISITSALEAGLTRPDEPFFCENGSYKVGPATIHDAERIGDTTLTGVLAMSSNICTAKIAARQGRERLRDMMVRFGFGKQTGIDLPGERAGQLRALGKMGPVETATTSFGQGMTATPLQIATAYAAIANGGTLYRPHVTRRILDEEGSAMSTVAAEGHRIIAPELAAMMRSLLFAVTQKGGTGSTLLLPGYKFGGKTGTAQKVDPETRQYSKDKWASSFVGFAPLEDPQLVIYVVVDEPQGTHFGSMVAGPVFVETMNDALRWLGVRPTESTPASRKAAATADGDGRRLTETADGDGRRLSATADGDGRRLSVTVTAMADGLLPDLRGLGVGEAVARAASIGMRVEVVGSGIAVEQSPAAGTVRQAVAGGSIRLTCRPPG